MNLPIAWVVAGAIPVSQAITQVTSLAGTSASHFFGDLLKTNQQSPNPSPAGSGHSERVEKNQNPKTNREKDSWSERVASVRSYLSKFVSDSRARYGLQSESSPSDGIALVSDGKNGLEIKGREPTRTELEQHLQQHPDLVQEIKDLALQSAQQGPLQWLPKQAASAKAGEPWTLWLND